MNEKTTRMVFATAAVAAVAAVLTGPAGAVIPEGNGVQAVGATSEPQAVIGAQTIPYLSQGIGIDTSQFAGEAPPTLGGVHAALGLTGDSVLTRVSGVSGPAAATASNGSDFDWTSFGAGAGMVALLAAGLAGVLLATRRRHTVSLP